MPNLVGTGLNQVPTNSMLGGMAYQDPEHASIKDLDLRNLSQINAEISDTAVDIFVYDTRKDSDGGAWRKRTQDKSWYIEDLGTATRGTRREFPAVAVIVAESNPNKVTIYDGDDPDLPMWMVFNVSPNTNANFLSVQGQVLSSISMLNGDLCVGFPSANGWGISRINFLSDSQGWYWTSAVIYKQVKNLIAERNLLNGYTSGVGTSGLKNARVNDIDMTVIPNAQIDDATGLPIPTVALATEGGIMVIKDDGQVIDLSDNLGATRAFKNVIIHGEDVIGYNQPNGTVQRFFNALKLGGDFDVEMKYNYTYAGGGGSTENISAVLRKTAGAIITVDKGKTVKDFCAVSVDGLSLFYDGEDRTFTPTQFTIKDSAVAYITSDYNTGYMHGDIKGAFLSDTDTTNITNTTNNVVTNPNFASDSNWTKESGWSITSGVARWTQSGGSHGRLSQTITLTPGVNYVATVIVTDVASNGDVWLEVRDTNLSGTVRLQKNIGAGAAAGVYAYNFTAVTATNVVILHSYSQDTFDADDLYIYPAEEDRSINNKGLQVFGTVPKQVVATGADLVSYGPFSTTNYLQQPYNADFLLGTSDWCVSGWVKNNSDNNSIYEDIITFGNIGQVGYSSMEPGTWTIQMNRQYGYNMYYRTSAGHLDSGWTAHSASGSHNKYSLNGQDVWYKITITKRGNRIYSWTNADFMGSKETVGSMTTSSNLDDMRLTIGYEGGNAYGPYFAQFSKMALWRISKSSPSDEQIKKMYEDEKDLFQENAKATLYGSSDAITASAFDDTTDILHVGTSAGRSEFHGLRRINNTTDAVTTAISASNGLVAEQ